MSTSKNGEYRYLDIIAGWVRTKPQEYLAVRQFRKSKQMPFGSWVTIWEHEDKDLVARAIKIGERYNRGPFDR